MRKNIVISALVVGALTTIGIAPSSAAPRKVAVRSHGQIHKPVRAVVAARFGHGAARRVYARAVPDERPVPLMGFLFGIAPQYGDEAAAPRADRIRVSHRRSAAPDAPSPDDEPVADTPSVDSSSSAGADASAAAIQQMNDQNALNASMAAAEQQNEAAQASALQAELNAANN